MNANTKKIIDYAILNRKAEKNATVFFGADYLSDIPICELADTYLPDTLVYNRSLKGLDINTAQEVLDSLVCSLQPDKVFVCLGENDVKKPDFELEIFAEKFEWLLYTLHARCNCKIFILSVPDAACGQINTVLQSISQKHGCVFIDTRDCRASFLQLFSKIRFFLRSHPITFFEAMHG